MLWLILTIYSAISVSVARIIQRHVLKQANTDAFAFSFIFPVFVSFCILGYTLATGTFELPNLSSSILNLFLMIIFYSVGSIAIYNAYKYAPASEVSIIFASNSAWGVISAIIFLGEKLTATSLIGIVSIIIGIVVINYSKSSWKLESGHAYALLAALMFGVAFTNDTFIMRHYHTAPPYVFLAFILPALTILLYRPSIISKVRVFFHRSILPLVLLSSVIYGTSAIAIYTAYKVGGHASIILPIQQTSTIATLILSYIFLDEKSKIIQKIVGTILVVTGAIILI